MPSECLGIFARSLRGIAFPSSFTARSERRLPLSRTRFIFRNVFWFCRLQFWHVFSILGFSAIQKFTASTVKSERRRQIPEIRFGAEVCQNPYVKSEHKAHADFTCRVWRRPRGLDVLGIRTPLAEHRYRLGRSSGIDSEISQVALGLSLHGRSFAFVMVRVPCPNWTQFRFVLRFQRGPRWMSQRNRVGK